MGKDTRVKQNKGRKDQLDLVRMVHKTTSPSHRPGWSGLSNWALKLWDSQQEKESPGYTFMGSKKLLKMCVWAVRPSPVLWSGCQHLGRQPYSEHSIGYCWNTLNVSTWPNASSILGQVMVVMVVMVAQGCPRKAASHTCIFADLAYSRNEVWMSWEGQHHKEHVLFNYR